MSDKQSLSLGGTRTTAAADEFQEISYYAWRRGFAGPKAAAQTPTASSSTTKDARLFKF